MNDKYMSNWFSINFDIFEKNGSYLWHSLCTIGPKVKFGIKISCWELDECGFLE